MLTDNKVASKEFYGSENSRALALLRWPLAMCIVAVHWFRWGSLAGTAGIDAENTVGYPVFHALNSFADIFLSENGVATFFFISGFLFFAGGEFTADRYKVKVKKRFFSLFIPYILWNLLMVGFIAAHYLPIFASVFDGMQAEGFHMTAGDFFKGFFFTESPHNANMWFIRELMLNVLLAPLLYYLLKRWSLQTMIALLAVSILLADGSGEFVRRFSWSTFFFALGSSLAVKRVDLVGVTSGKGWLAFFLFAGLCTAGMLVRDYSEHLFMVCKLASLPAMIAMALAIAGWLVRKRGMKASVFLSSATFFVFAFHPMFIYEFQKVLARVFRPESDWALTLTFFLGYVVALMLMLGVYRLCMKLMPSVTRILTGKRS